MVKRTQTIRRLLPHCLSVFDPFSGLALKGLTKLKKKKTENSQAFNFPKILIDKFATTKIILSTQTYPT